MPEVSVRFLIDNQGTIPSCFVLQLLFLPDVMYFISLVRFPMVENPSRSVRRPGTELDDGEPSSTRPILQVGSYSLVPLPDSPSLKVQLENVKRERRDSDDAEVDVVDHDWGCGGEGKKQAQFWG